MKIGPLESQPVVAPATTDRKTGAAVNKGAASAEASAKVALSSTATALTSGSGVEASFDQAKVDRISESIRDGKFKINPEVIADKLIANAQELLGKAGG
jgi:negative regulator of flagellin synthesis FlgM